MTHTFPELVIGGVLIAPFVTYVVAALIAFALLRPVLVMIGFDAWFSNPPLAEVCLLVIILALLIALF